MQDVVSFLCAFFDKHPAKHDGSCVHNTELASATVLHVKASLHIGHRNSRVDVSDKDSTAVFTNDVAQVIAGRNGNVPCLFTANGASLCKRVFPHLSKEFPSFSSIHRQPSVSFQSMP